MGASAIQKIEAALNKIEFMQQLEDKTQVKKLYIAAALAVVTVVFILFGFGAGLLCNFVGFVYPAFASFKALDSKNEGEERNWLIYWVVYSCFCLVEGFLEYVLFWVPFYYPIKLAFLCFLFLPQTQVVHHTAAVCLLPVSCAASATLSSTLTLCVAFRVPRSCTRMSSARPSSHMSP